MTKRKWEFSNFTEWLNAQGNFIKTSKPPRFLAERAWDHQQHLIDGLTREIEEALEQIKELKRERQ